MDALVGDQLLDRHFGVAANAASVRSLSPTSQLKMWLWCRRAPWAPSVLPARSSRSTGASASSALNGSTSGGSLVLDLDQLDGVGRDIAVVGDDEGDLLVLEQHLLVRQHRLHVAGQRRHLMQFQRLQIGGGQHRDHAGQRLGLRRRCS